MNSPAAKQKVTQVYNLLNKVKTTEENSRIQLLLQAQQHFEEIFRKTPKNSSFLQNVFQICKLFLINVKDNLKLILADANSSKKISDTITLFIRVPFIIQSISQDSICSIVLKFLSNDFSNSHQFPGLPQFQEFFALFFSTDQFVATFENNKGLWELWKLLLTQNNPSLNDMIFSEISKTIHLYFQGEDLEPAFTFLQFISSKFHQIKEANVFYAFQFIYDLLSNGKPQFLSKFIEIGGFTSINEYIVKKNDPQLVVFYQTFRAMCTEMPPDQTNESHPILHQLVLLICYNHQNNPNIKTDPENENESNPIEVSALNQLNQAFSQFPINQCPLNSSDFIDLGKNISGNESFYLLLRIFSNLLSTFPTRFDNVHCLSILPLIINSEIAKTSSLSSLFESIKKNISEVKFSKISLEFYHSITKTMTTDEFESFLKKYPIAFQFLNSIYLLDINLNTEMNEQLLFKLFMISPSFTIKEEIYSKLLKYSTNLEILFKFLQNNSDENVLANLMKILLYNFEISSDRRQLFIKSHLIEKFNNIKVKPELIFDLMVSLAGTHFSVELDSVVSSFLKSVNYFDMPNEAIHKLAFALYQNNSLTEFNKHLIFPSLLSRCDQFEITSPYDMWLCGQYGIEKWLQDTGKTIDQFPCLSQIAQRYLLPKHIQYFFNYPKLFSESCRDIFGSIPLFEFPKRIYNTKIDLSTCLDSGIRSVSFWFFFKEYAPSLQNLCTFYNIEFGSMGDELYVNKTIISEFPLNRWIHVVISFNEKNQAAIYLDSKNLYSLTLNSNLNHPLIFGTNELNGGYWFLGGCIRVFKKQLDQESVGRLFSLGVRFITKYEEDSKSIKEHLLILPTTFIDLFGDRKSDTNNCLSENSRPVISYSFLHHIKEAYDGSECAFKLIFERLQENKFDDCTHFLDSLCSFQKFNYSGWSSKVFAVRMNAIFLLCPKLFDINTISNILNYFTSDYDDTIMWDSILSFILDFGLLNSEHRSFIISKLFEYVAQFKVDMKVNITMIHFIYHVLMLIDCDESDRRTLLALVEKIKPIQNHAANLIASLPNYVENFQNPSFVYDNKYDNLIYESLFDYLLNNNDTFTNYYLLNLLPPGDSFKLIPKLLSRNNSHALTINDRLNILHFCLSKTEMKESWASIVSVLFNKSFTMKSFLASKEISIKEPELFPIFIHFLSFLSIHAINNTNDKFWRELWNKFIDIARYLIPNITQIDSKLLFALDQLLSFGKYSKFLTIFPFAPSIKDPEELYQIASQQGQPFSKSSERVEMPPAYKLDSSMICEEIQKIVMEILPKKRFLLPPQSNQLMTCHRQQYQNLDFIKEVYDANNKIMYNDWNTFVPPRQFKIDQLRKLPIYKDVFRFTAEILLNFISKPDVFKENYTHLSFSNGLLSPMQSIAIFQSLFSELFQLCIARRKFDPFLIDFTCLSVCEGWFRGTIVPIFKVMFELIIKTDQKSLTKMFRSLLIHSFGLMENGLLSYLKLFYDFKDIIFSKPNLEKLDFVLLLYDKLISVFSSLKQQTTEIINIFVTRLAHMPLNDSDEVQIYKFVSLSLKQLVKTANPSLNQQEFESFTKRVDEIKSKFETEMKNDIVEHIQNTVEFRMKGVSSFYDNAHCLINLLNNQISSSLSVASIVRYHERSMFLFDEEVFLRVREKLLTGHCYFQLNLTKTKTLSILSDPILPTRRFEKSPMLYEIPQFPAVDVTDVTPKFPIVEDHLTILPELLKNKLQLDYKPYETLMMHSPNQLNVTFSYHIMNDDILLLQILQSTLNLGRPFKLMKNTSLLYGLDPLVGSFLVGSQNLYFIEGLSIISNTQVRFTHDSLTMPNALYSFYISYMISGYFGPCYLFSGHPVLSLPKHLLLSSLPHFWLQKSISLEIQFLFGWSFILIANSSSDYSDIHKYLNKIIERNYNRLPLIPPTKSFLSSLKSFGQTCPNDSVLSPIKSAKLLQLSLKEITKEWIDRNISNFDYLCILNKLGSRSYIDLSQYMVFPWIISDYLNDYSDINQIPLRDLSLPMGQIGKNRLERFDQVFQDSENSYFYGSHYMHLGVVLFYLFRNDPFCLFSIYFHHGYDHPNRIFHDIAEAWNSSALVSPSDVKEMVPQMYYVHEFLTNTSSLPLTTTTDGRPVQDVKLAKWASNSIDFTKKMRKELESARVSKTINDWIDLIFGYKSRGEAAIEAKNLFQPLCYQTSSEQTTSYDDNIDKEAAITCIINFGQCPKQLFQSPHIKRILSDEKNHLLSDPSLIITQKLNTAEFKWPINDLVIGNFVSSSISIFSSSQDLNNSKILMNCIISYSEPRGAIVKQQINNFHEGLLSISLGSNTPTVTKLFDSGISVDFIELSPDGSLCAVFQKEGSFTLHVLEYEKGEVQGEVKCEVYRTHFQTLSNVSSACISTAHFIVICACGSIVQRFDLALQTEVDSIDAGFVVRKVAIDDKAALIIVAGDNDISIYSISGAFLCNTKINEKVTSLKPSNLDEFIENRFFITGHENGSVKFWTIDYTKNEIVMLKSVDCFTSAESSNNSVQLLAIDGCSKRVIAVSVTEMVSFDYYHSSQINLKKCYALECCCCGDNIVSKPAKVCNICKRFYCTKCEAQSNTKYKSLCKHCSQKFSETLILDV